MLGSLYVKNGLFDGSLNAFRFNEVPMISKKKMALYNLKKGKFVLLLQQRNKLEVGKIYFSSFENMAHDAADALDAAMSKKLFAGGYNKTVQVNEKTNFYGIVRSVAIPRPTQGTHKFSVSIVLMDPLSKGGDVVLNWFTNKPEEENFHLVRPSQVVRVKSVIFKKWNDQIQLTGSSSKAALLILSEKRVAQQHQTENVVKAPVVGQTFDKFDKEACRLLFQFSALYFMTQSLDSYQDHRSMHGIRTRTYNEAQSTSYERMKPTRPLVSPLGQDLMSCDVVCMVVSVLSNDDNSNGVKIVVWDGTTNGVMQCTDAENGPADGAFSNILPTLEHAEQSLLRAQQYVDCCSVEKLFAADATATNSAPPAPYTPSAYILGKETTIQVSASWPKYCLNEVGLRAPRILLDSLCFIHSIHSILLPILFHSALLSLSLAPHHNTSPHQRFTPRLHSPTQLTAFPIDAAAG